MKAFAVTPNGIELVEREPPAPGRGEVRIEVTTIALNRGECRRAVHGGWPPGTVPGWDTVGVVREIGPDTNAPAIGTIVAARGLSGGWAESRIVHIDDLAEVPADMDPAQAASLVTAGTTALAVLTRNGPILGRRILVTAASGSVGRLAVQLARIGGAHVLAQSRDAADWLKKLGADQVIRDLSEVDSPVDLIIDSLGGPALVQAINLLSPGGVIQNFGWTLGEPATFEGMDALMTTGSTLQGFAIGQMRVGKLLRRLIPLAQSGALVSGITTKGTWTTLPHVAAKVLQPGFRGKAVLSVD